MTTPRNVAYGFGPFRIRRRFWKAELPTLPPFGRDRLLPQSRVGHRWARVTCFGSTRLQSRARKEVSTEISKLSKQPKKLAFSSLHLRLAKIVFIGATHIRSAANAQKFWNWKGSSYPPSGVSVHDSEAATGVGGPAGRHGRAPRIESAHVRRPLFRLILRSFKWISTAISAQLVTANSLTLSCAPIASQAVR